MKKTLFLAFIVIFSASGCSKYQKLIKSTDVNAKYEGAIKYYEKGDYIRALPLLEELVPVLRGTARGEKVYYSYAYTQYHLGDFITGAYHFENFATSYPTSQYAEECWFMSAFCYYRDSPVSSLDQTQTIKAIRQFQLFVNKYPRSNRLTQCNELIDLLRLKLETKTYEIARIYYDKGDYNAAMVAFENVLKEYPATKRREEVLFLAFKSSYLYATKSVEAKQQERYTKATELYQRYSDEYPNGINSKEAKTMNENAVKLISKFAVNDNNL